MSGKTSVKVTIHAEYLKELDEAANIDGCGTWGIFIRVIFPLMRPALATIGIYTFHLSNLFFQLVDDSSLLSNTI